MNKFRKIALLVLVLELAIFVCSYFYIKEQSATGTNGMVRVEIKRALDEARKGSGTEKEILGIAKNYPHIISIRPYDENQVDNRAYQVEEIGGRLYRFYYIDSASQPGQKGLLFTFIAVFIVTGSLLLYVARTILRPFENITQLTGELAKGNLSRPLKQEKSGYLKQFLWSMDMLREQLEDNKRREMEFAKEKKSLVLSLAHDIKTPLAAIDLYTKALEDNLYTDEDKKTAALHGIQKNKEDIREYVNRIVEASREDFLNQEVHMQEVYLSDVIAPIKRYYQDKLSLLNISFSIEPYQNCLIRCDEDRLVEAIQNGMENAIKYGDGKKISLAVSEEEDCKLISITNTGCRLKETEVDNVFDSFYRGSNATGIPGSGLGLYICRDLLHKMDGEVFARVTPPLFHLTFVVRKI